MNVRYVATINGTDYLIEIVDDRRVLLNGQICEVDFAAVGDQPIYSLLLDGKSYEAYVYSQEDEWQVLLLGNLYSVRVEDEREKRLRAAAGGRVMLRSEFHLKAPMPGLVIAVPVIEGQRVQKGDVLVILESMKMQNELKSPREGVVTRIRVAAGDSVEQSQTMLSIV
ncbi:MAG: acetyl-CoA carboxylase biotin carboxyl carrier protein subunit [Anaerolineales bacterium]|nr:acetyl-CoA carboxylase biotin carboxyl carrier protein subunit [Anaerolineales bacterium]MCS7247001.1 acetyl-CoA carboxylase biotin carboxyl carrier protein subunit [Anaerolineales bacterium]MDW8160812.1 acetyl-CoA carboxylase biotin carboxyl carrier protein subunit [Anaerolineales bacterium]MDW8446791.1 acetyl-CoA carboxylase biotin carboxyl carrier protein subunit [Anaerolineales bacterium]